MQCYKDFYTKKSLIFMGSYHFVDTTQDYQKREAMRFIGYGIIFILLFYGLSTIARGGSIKIGLILILISNFFWYLSKWGDKRNKKIFGRY